MVPIEQILLAVAVLLTLGVLITAVLVAGFARWVLGFSWLEGLLLGSIVSPTDAAAVFSVLRSRTISLKGRITLLELESGSNDPMAVFLTMGFIQLITHPQEPVVRLVPMFFLQMGIGAAVGLVSGRVTIGMINRLKLEAEGLYPVLTVAVVLLSYGATTILKGNGFMAVYLAGIMIGNGDFIHKRSLLRFHDGLAWPFARMQTRQKALVSWVGLRGAVPIILATFPMVAGIPQAELYFNLVFFIVLTSALLQGTTIPFAARKLGLEAPSSPRKQYPLEFVPTRKTRSDMVEIHVPPNSPAASRQIVDLHLPKSALIALIERNEDYIAPRGATVLRPGDSLLVLIDKNDIPSLRSAIDPPAVEPDETERGHDGASRPPAKV